MNTRKFEIIIHATDAAACQRLIQSLQAVNVPEDFDAAIQPVTGDEKYFAYDTAMRSSDAKYKIYIDEHAIINDENFLHELLEIFRDESIGAVGTSGAVELSTHGVSLTSAKRADENFRGEVEIVDGFFFATQYDLPWRVDLFTDNFSADKLNASSSNARATKFSAAEIGFISTERTSRLMKRVAINSLTNIQQTCFRS